ncbi:hypothetical protein ALQ84_101362 [Pseudomonas caricapapayae]|uniref:Uncharacterized protein n=1 Tax=Pseudomonas caricapapayae TaxID=46678 RepID=A0A3M6GUK8_9PSED|nr:hypothetical protein ALQ84_101362 [Pseudomonas caricapapayae]RMV96127.1 hypothetical protein ALP01_101014 [Pseudomonas caricapapayae]
MRHTQVLRCRLCCRFAAVRGRVRSYKTWISRTSEGLLRPGGRGSGLVREGLQSGPKTGHLGCILCTEAPGLAAGSRQFADKSAPTNPGYRGQAKGCFGPEDVGADLSAKGCKAAPKQATLVVSCAPRRLVLLPVPGSSRTSPLLQTLDIADKRRAASAPKQATLVVSGAPRRLVLLPVRGSSRTSPLLQNLDIADKRRAASAPKQATLIVSGAPRRLVWLPVPGSSRTSPLLQNLHIADKRSVVRLSCPRRSYARSAPSQYGCYCAVQDRCQRRRSA